MDVKYDYNLDNIIDYGIQDDQTMIDAILKEALPLLPVKIKAPNFGCTVFCLTDADGDVHMGRNYDFSKDTSAMLVYCAPKDGYKSIAFAALDNVSANVPDENIINRMGGRRACVGCGATYHVVNMPPKKEGICDHCGEKLVLREDDKPETVKKRLQVYHDQTKPLIEYYDKKGSLLTVDGTLDINVVFEKITEVLG